MSRQVVTWCDFVGDIAFLSSDLLRIADTYCDKKQCLQQVEEAFSTNTEEQRSIAAQTTR